MLRKNIMQILNSQLNLSQIYGLIFDLVIKFKENGGKQEDAIICFEEIFSLIDDYNENKIDVLRDIGDYVWGWCTPENKIWKDE